jgi:hypothetical protein
MAALTLAQGCYGIRVHSGCAIIPTYRASRRLEVGRTGYCANQPTVAGEPLDLGTPDLTVRWA